jgi:hypothetical protein
MIAVTDLLDEASAGFLPHDGGGRDLNATLATLPAMFGSFRDSLTALAAWMEEFPPARDSAASVTEMARNASDQYRKENEFWLGDDPGGQMSPAVYGLTEMAGSGFIPDGSYTTGYQLADQLEAFPELTDLIGENLGILAGWMRDNHMSGTPELLVTELANSVSVLSVASETASTTYQRQNAFWLSSRTL